MANIVVDASKLKNVKVAMAVLPQEAKKALSKTLNRATDNMIKNIQKEVADEYAVKTVGIKKTLDIKKSTVRTLTAEVKSTDRRIKISGFKFKASGPMRIARVQIKKGGFVQSTANPPLFVGRANKTTGNREVFVRTPGGIHKISFGFTISIPQMIRNEEVYNVVATKAHAFIEKEFPKYMAYQVSQIAKREGLTK